jgi:exodeoxyribonuclease VII large subunit
VTALRERLSPRGLQRGIEANRALLERSFAALAAVVPREVIRQRERLEALGRRLDVLSPLATLQRGYAIAEREDGHVVAHAADVESGDALAVRFQDGRIRVHVNLEQEEP